jgi:hypothetical protein
MHRGWKRRSSQYAGNPDGRNGTAAEMSIVDVDRVDERTAYQEEPR